MTCKLIHGDAFEEMQKIDPGTVDLVFTDPPYPKKYAPLFMNLGIFSAPLMVRGASLVFICPHYLVQDVMSFYSANVPLKYRWMLCMNQFGGKHPRMAMGIEVMWKPMLWYVKDAYQSGRGFLKDGIEITGTAGQRKELHKWEQDISWAKYHIEKLTKPGDLVIDPFVGSGTVAVACLELGRNFIGIDNCEESVETAQKRVDIWKTQNS